MILDAFTSYALKVAISGGLPSWFMPESEKALRDAGLVTASGQATDAGRAAWKTYAQTKNDDALMRNLIPNVKAEAMRALGRLLDGQEPTEADERALRPHQSLAWRHPRTGEWRVTITGRRAYGLAAARTN